MQANEMAWSVILFKRQETWDKITDFWLFNEIRICFLCLFDLERIFGVHTGVVFNEKKIAADSVELCVFISIQYPTYKLYE